MAGTDEARDLLAALPDFNVSSAAAMVLAFHADPLLTHTAAAAGARDVWEVLTGLTGDAAIAAAVALAPHDHTAAIAPF